MEDPMPLGRHGALPLGDVILRVSRSSGPGGQHANVTASRVEAVLELDTTTALNETQKRRLRGRYGPRVVAVAQDARSQARNRELALERLQARLLAGLATRRPRVATRPSESAVRRRLELKRRNSDRKRARRAPTGEEG